RRKIIPVEPTRSWPPQPLRRLIEIEVMFSKVFTEQNSRGMAHGSSTDLRRRRRNRRGIQHRECRPPGFFFENLVFESSAGIAASCHARIALDWIVSEAQLQILCQSKFQQPVDILVPFGSLQPILDFENTRLYRLRGR